MIGKVLKQEINSIKFIFGSINSGSKEKDVEVGMGPDEERLKLLTGRK